MCVRACAVLFLLALFVVLCDAGCFVLWLSVCVHVRVFVCACLCVYVCPVVWMAVTHCPLVLAAAREEERTQTQLILCRLFALFLSGPSGGSVVGLPYAEVRGAGGGCCVDGVVVRCQAVISLVG